MRARLLVPVLLTAALVGCGSGSDGTTDTDPTTPSSDGALVTYEKGGGFAPVFQKLVIESDGSATATASFPGDRPQERTAEFKLADDELAELTDAVGSTELEPYEETGYCADCFTYSITSANGSTDFDEGMLGALGDEEPIVDDDVSELNSTLGGLLEEHVPGPDPQAGA